MPDVGADPPRFEPVKSRSYEGRVTPLQQVMSSSAQRKDGWTKVMLCLPSFLSPLRLPSLALLGRGLVPHGASVYYRFRLRWVYRLPWQTLRDPLFL